MDPLPSSMSQERVVYRLTENNVNISQVGSEQMRDTVHNLMQDTQEHSAGSEHRIDPTFSQGETGAADIQGFLERPVKIFEDTWAPGADYTAFFNPWELFLNNPAVAKKLDNYKLLRGNLMVTFMINGTPQHAGLILASYSYLATTNEIVSIGGDDQLVTRSQRPHVYLNPSLCRGGCLCLPFFWHENYIDLQRGTYPLGRINVDSFQPLTLLDSGTESVNITAFAHMTDIMLTVPTHSNFVPASGKSSKKKKGVTATTNDEYSKDGPVSSVASAVAAASRALVDVPVIGMFARATDIGATAVGAIASLFGFSKPNEIKDGAFMRNTPYYSMATSDGSDLSQKLTVTRKQEITVDPTTVGLEDCEDALAINKMASVESYITQFPWTVSQLSDVWIFSISVKPTHYRMSGTAPTRIIPTAAAYVARPFNYWSGTTKFRFQIVCSQFTRGRLAFVYDPNGLGGTSNDTYNTTMTTIIDISETKDFTIEIPWMQPQPYLTHNSTSAGNTWSNNGTASDPFANGVLAVRVLNRLVQPDGLTPVAINVFTSAGDDFEVANPNGFEFKTMRFKPTSGTGESETIKDSEDAPEQTEMVVTLPAVSSAIDHKAMVFFGERVGSLRQLIKRFTFYRALDTAANSAIAFASSNTFSQFPAYRTLAGGGPDSIGAGTGYQVSNTYLNYVTRAFAGWRGGVRYKMVYTNADYGIVVRYVASGLSTLLSRAVDTFPNANTEEESTSTYLGILDDDSSGTVVTNSNMRGLEVEIPYASPYRFSNVTTSNNGDTTYLPYGCGWKNVSFMRGVDTIPGTYVQGVDMVYVAAADDFQVFGFVGAPVYWDEN